MDPRERERRRLRSSVGLSLNYPRSGVSAPGGTPEGWLEASADRSVDAGAQTFDRLATDLFELRLHRAAGLHAERVDGDCAMDILQVDSGRFRGLYRVVEMIDEVLTQGVVIGTGAGNHTCAEHRVQLDFDPARERIDVSVSAVWKPARRFLLPGGAAREEGRHRELVEALADATTGRR